MINPHIKNMRTGCHEDILNRNCHYLKVLNSKSALDNKINQRFFPKRTKHTLDPNLAIAKQNLHLYKRLLHLERSPPRYILLGKDTPEAIISQKKGRKTFVRTQKKLQISEDNVRLLRKIQSVESDLALKKIRKAEIQRKPESMIEPHIRNLSQMEDYYYATFQREMFRSSTKSKERRQVRSSMGRRDRPDRSNSNRKRVQTETGVYPSQ